MYEYIFQQFPGSLLPKYDETSTSITVDYSMIHPVLFPYYDAEVSYLMFFHVIA
jgi:hypothetical protein